MEDTKGWLISGKQPVIGNQAFLPPKIPTSWASQSYADYSLVHDIGLEGIGKPSKGHNNHQRTLSEGFLIEEQPSWLDDLLDEPEMPVKRVGHRRSSSDTSAYLGAAALSVGSALAPGCERNRNSKLLPSWGPAEFDRLNEAHHSGYYMDLHSSPEFQSRGWVPALDTVARPTAIKEKVVYQGVLSVTEEPNTVTPIVAGNQDSKEAALGQKGSFERTEGSNGKHPQSDIDTKRVKQQYAQRSRVRKLQYIAELERNVQALQVESLEVTGELDFLNQQNLMINLENKALNQRLDSLAQEHLIKCFQHEMLEREIARLRVLMFHQQQQQQPQQQPTPTHSRRNSRDLDSQFANLSLKQKEANSGRDPVNGSHGI